MIALYIFVFIHLLLRIQAHKDTNHEHHDDAENVITISLNDTHSGQEFSDSTISMRYNLYHIKHQLAHMSHISLVC